MNPIEIVSPHGRARISLQGAQVLDAELDGVPLLWMSPLASTEPGKAVRGGVPICFPWFGKHPDGLPAHGFARNQMWTLCEQHPDKAVFELSDNADTRNLWPYAFRMALTITVESTLQFDLLIENRDLRPISFSYALHSYFAVTHVHQCQVEGLDGRLRREIAHVTTPQQGTVLLDRPIDASFESAEGPLLLRDGNRCIHIEASHMRSAVVWNPGAAAESVSDIGVHWPEYVCVERGNIGMANVHLAVGEVHRASMHLSV